MPYIPGSYGVTTPQNLNTPNINARADNSWIKDAYRFFHPGTEIDRDWKHNEAILADERVVRNMQNAERWKIDQYKDMGINPVLMMGGAVAPSGGAQASGDAGGDSHPFMEALGMMANYHHNAKQMALKERQLDILDKEATAKIVALAAKKIK